MSMRVWRKGNRSALLVGMSIVYSHYGKQYGGSSKELKCDPAIPLLNICLKKMKTLIIIKAPTPTVTAASHTIAK